jgi:3',5'-cyclic AMP phosphodiesterase CpdA/thymidylate synthase
MERASAPKKIRLLHVTDSHLDSISRVATRDIKTNVGGIVHPLRQDLLRGTFEGLANSMKSIGEKIDAVIISGDSTLRGNKDGQTVLRHLLLSLLGEVGVSEANIIVTPGNHDVVAGTAPGTRDRYVNFIESWLAPNPVVVPFLDGVHELRSFDENSHVLVDPNKNWAVFPVNSANWSQLRLPASENPHVALLLEHINKSDEPELLKAFQKLISYDMARVSDDQFTALRRAVDKVGNVGLRIAVLHHHLLPVGSEEIKPFADMTNLGVLRQVLRELGFGMVIHGHKHTATAYYDHIYSELDPEAPAHRVLTISGGTFGPTGQHPDNPLQFIEISDLPSAPTCTIRSVSSAKPGLALQYQSSSPYPLWEADANSIGPISLFGKSIDELYARAISTLKANSNRTIICTIDFENDSTRSFPLAYPYNGNDEQLGDWFEETVKWWQISSSRSEGRIPYIHGNRLKRFAGGIDQIKRIIEIVKKGEPTSRALAFVVDPTRDFGGNKTFASFCFVQFCIRKENGQAQLDCVGYYRAQEFNHWWPVNIAELRHLQLEIVSGASGAPGQLVPGSITTISPYPRLSGDARQPTKVAIPLIDQWADSHPIRIAKIALAISQGSESMGYREGNDLWGRCLNDLEQATLVYHADGVPIAIEGLELLKDWILAADPSSIYASLIEDLVSTNKTMPEKLDKVSFDGWSSSVKKTLTKLRGLSLLDDA